jgi:penicillin G amidase
MALQTDDYTVNGRRLTKPLAPLVSNEPAISQGLELLKTWDHRTSADSAAATVFEVWMMKHLGKATIAKATPEAARALIAIPDIASVIDLMENPDTSLGANPRAERDSLLLESLGRAVKEVRDRQVGRGGSCITPSSSMPLLPWRTTPRAPNSL